MPILYQVNLQTSPGGGEIYTRFFTEALAALGWNSVLVVARGARFWESMRLPARLLPLSDGDLLAEALPEGRSLVLTHNVLGPALAAAIAQRHTLAGFVHMPFYGRAAAGLPRYARLFAVSGYVRDSLVQLGLSASTHPEPLYGVGDLRVRDADAPPGIAAGRLYDRDRRKFRDHIVCAWEPLARACRRRRFARRPGLTLGVVSRLTPIKQFPLLFSLLAPVLARADGVNIEFFGSGGYASVRDLRRALRPIEERCRFWGEQSDIAPVYRELDYVLSGLPEKEALGLNLLEAQLAGTPVLAVDALPFTETVLDGATGHLFEDPRRDAAAGFAALLARIAAGKAPLDRSRAAAHLARFSAEAFRERVARALASLDAGRIGGHASASALQNPHHAA